MRPDFETTFEAEIAIFSPPEPVQQRASPTWRRSSPSNGGSTSTPGISSVMNGVRTEEASVVRPVSTQQRSTRLSFLNKRKPSDPAEANFLINGDVEPSTTSHGRTASKDPSRRASFFRVASSDALNRTPTEQTHTSVEDRRPSETSDKTPSLSKKGSVRKRLSMLKLGGGKKSGGKQGAMGSLDEE